MRLTVALGALVGVLFVTSLLIGTSWQPPGPALAALFGTAGHYSMTRAFQAAPMTVTQPVVFLQLIWASLLGTFAFGEGVDVWVIVGGAVMIGAISWITWRESQQPRRGTVSPGDRPAAPARWNG